MRLNLPKVRTVRTTMKMIPKTGIEVIRADRVHQEEGRVQEVSAHQKAVRGDQAEIPIILPGRAAAVVAKEVGHPEMMMWMSSLMIWTTKNLIKASWGISPGKKEVVYGSVKEVAEKYKWLCILTGGIGFFLSPFLWPFFLMIIFQSLSLAAPIIVAAFIIKTVREEKKDEQKSNNGSKQTETESTDFDTSKDVSDRGNSAYQKAEKADLSERYQKEGTQPLKESYMQHEKSEAECKAVVWYQMEGKERIQNLKVKLEKTGIRQFSISPEGVCCVPEGKYFRRVGMLRAFPAHETKILIQYLHKDHIHAVKKGKYLWLSWGKERK